MKTVPGTALDAAETFDAAEIPDAVATRATAKTTVPPLRPTRLLAASAGFALLSVIWFGVGVAQRTPPAIGWLLTVPPLAVGLAACWRAAAEGRTFWRYVCAALAVSGLGVASAARDHFGHPAAGTHVSGATSAIFVGGVLLVVAGLLRIRGKRRSRIEWTRFGLDIATVLVTLLAFCWHLAYPSWENWAASSGMLAILATVAATLVFLFSLVKVAFTGTGSVDRRALHLLSLTGVYGCCLGVLTPLLQSRPWLEMLHVLMPGACLLMTLAADRQRRATRVGVPPSRRARRRLSVLPYAAVLATSGLLLFSVVRHTEDHLAIAVASVTVTLLVAGRQLVALLDNARLVDDLTARRRELAHQATHDALTGLPNRTMLVREAAAALRADPGGVSIALIDLDDFKAINDDLGHVVGDALLVAVGERITEHLPAGCLVARLGGDEFALLLCGGDYGTPASVVANLRRPLQAGGHNLIVDASIGLTPARPGDTADELLRRADIAMYEAKEQGKGRQVVYSEEMEQRTAEQSRLAADLRAAIGTDQLHLLYQPIVAMPGGNLFGVEALVRWTHPERGPVGPVAFIPAAERTGLIVPLGAWILEEACSQAVRWEAELGPAAPRTVSVNVSARQLREGGFAAEVAAVLRRTRLAPHLLTVEVTETAVFDGGTAVAELQSIAALGVKIALDDFGTGHSSLGLLRTCPADILKVDKSFVDDITEGGQEAVVVAALIGICNGMRLRAVAEGVETAEQAAELYRLGYRYAQGYFFGRPMPADAIASFQPAHPASRVAA